MQQTAWVRIAQASRGYPDQSIVSLQREIFWSVLLGVTSPQRAGFRSDGLPYWSPQIESCSADNEAAFRKPTSASKPP